MQVFALLPIITLMEDKKTKLGTFVDAPWHKNLEHKNLNDFLGTLDPRQERGHTKLSNLVASKLRKKAMGIVDTAIAGREVKEQAG